ncbi:MAG TPA: ASCH domain-containing protein [Tepidisphaeraceae bacterium]|nr:ASCH domain-containing protein [Tepidisphaeraceae bacterium]
MSQLFFKGPLQAAIRAGKKTTTIRRWAKPLLQAGQRAYAPGVGWLEITDVQELLLERLTAADAKADGFETADALRKVLHEMYPNTRGDGKHWYRVAFKIAELAPPRRRASDEIPNLFVR